MPRTLRPRADANTLPYLRKGALSQNIRRARLYAEESAQLDVQNLDAERARSEVCAELAADVWSALSQRTARRRRVRPRLGLSPAA